jgi:hypothetical protein
VDFVKLKVTITFLMCAFGLFQAICVGAQERAWRLGIHGAMHTGSSKVNWNSDSPVGAFSSHDRWSENNELVGCRFMFVKNNKHLFGVMYEIQKTTLIDDSDILAERILEHHALAFYGQEFHSTSKKYMPGMVRFYAGYNNLRALDNSAYLLGYSSPNVFNTYWNGILYGMDAGLGFILGESHYALEIALSIRFSKLNLSRAIQEADQAELNAKGDIKGRLIGICFGFSRQQDRKGHESVEVP